MNKTLEIKNKEGIITGSLLVNEISSILRDGNITRIKNKNCDSYVLSVCNLDNEDHNKIVEQWQKALYDENKLKALTYSIILNIILANIAILMYLICS